MVYFISSTFPVPSACNNAPFSLLSFLSMPFPLLPSSVCLLSTMETDSQSVQVCLLTGVRAFFDVSSSLCRYYIWLMCKRLTVRSVLIYLFVSQWCKLRSSVAAKQPLSHWTADDSCFMLQPKTLRSALFSPSKLCWLLCLSLSNCSSVTVMKFLENEHLRCDHAAKFTLFELSWENHATIWPVTAFRNLTTTIINTSFFLCSHWGDNSSMNKSWSQNLLQGKYNIINKYSMSQLAWNWLLYDHQIYTALMFGIKALIWSLPTW